MKAIAVAKFIKGSPQKARLVIDLIRGRNASEALQILAVSRKRAAKPIETTLRSAIANAEQKAEAQNVMVDIDELYVKQCYVDSGPTKYRAGARRYRPAPRGRAYMERRRSSRITIVVSTEKSSGQ